MIDVVKLAQLTAQSQQIAEGIAVLQDKDREIKLAENMITHGNFRDTFNRIPGIDLCNMTLIAKEAREFILERMMDRMHEIAGEIKRLVENPTPLTEAKEFIPNA